MREVVGGCSGGDAAAATSPRSTWKPESTQQFCSAAAARESTRSRAETIGRHAPRLRQECVASAFVDLQGVVELCSVVAHLLLWMARVVRGVRKGG
jgi:hypothetical protein